MAATRNTILGIVFLLAVAIAVTPALSERAANAEVCPEGIPQRFATECEASLKLKNANMEMEAALKELQQRLSKPAYTALQRAQEAWVPFMNRSCDYEETSWKRGTGTTAMIILCQARHTSQRTEQFGAYLHCSGNGCPQ